MDTSPRVRIYYRIDGPRPAQLLLFPHWSINSYLGQREEV
ncbi:hypothetical protein E2C01_066797 [Portunus trituberculatus]|uniref:Uncharacterized protein n=1 Tax=Portunus trituberculatus TaxID=210409 RepID=A0A5B7HUU0_PORTR|nr:hypothetical protein [Portunus trituberculatus]